jgi:C4-dicarboxylate-specific signal transduction histidine kinase
MNIISSTLLNYNIKIEIKIDEKIKIKTYLNEYKQVLLNILNNAKDILIEKNIEKPLIKISAYEEDNYVVLYIEDNGGGVIVEPKGKIFEPYFTTKEDSNGTGIGLYMSKIIVDKNMKGKLRVRNTKCGAKFAIFIPKDGFDKEIKYEFI